MRYFLSLLFALFLTACSGYKPTPAFASDIFETPVLVKVKIDPEDPDIGVYLEDEIAKMAINRLNLTLTKNVNEAKNYILVNSYTINTSPINKDENGNIIRYSVNSAIEFAIKDKYGFWSKNIVSSSYVVVKPQSIVGALDKEKAAKIAIQKALDQFIISVMKRSRKVGSNKVDLEDANRAIEELSKKKYEDTIISESKPQKVQQDTPSNNVNSSLNNSVDTNQTNINPDINIVPVDDSSVLVQDATMYN